MKTKNLFALMMFVVPFLFISCGKNETDDGSFDFKLHDYRVDNVLYPKGSKLKRIYNCFDNYRSLNAEYQYDNFGRISRVDFGTEPNIRFDIYSYNSKGELEKISSYYESLENPSNLSKTIVYSYDTDGNKIKEQTEWFSGLMEVEISLYQYNGKKLVKQEYYRDDQLKYYKIFEYENDKLIKEKFLVPNSPDYGTTEHFYDKTLLVYSVQYSNNSKTDITGDERKYYDRNDNLIRKVANIPGLSSSVYYPGMAFYVTNEYEYE